MITTAQLISAGTEYLKMAAEFVPY